MGIFSKTAEYLKERLGKTRAKISNSLATVLSLGRKIDDDLLNELEETLISWADLFFSKSPGELWRERSVAEARQHVARWGERPLALFDVWRARFEEDP